MVTLCNQKASPPERRASPEGADACKRHRQYTLEWTHQRERRKKELIEATHAASTCYSHSPARSAHKAHMRTDRAGGVPSMIRREDPRVKQNVCGNLCRKVRQMNTTQPPPEQEASRCLREPSSPPQRLQDEERAICLQGRPSEHGWCPQRAKPHSRASSGSMERQ